MSTRPPNWREIARQDAQLAATNPINRRPPTRAPYVSELLALHVIQRALEETWRDTQADDSAHGNPSAIEQGGWIYMDLRTGQISIRRALASRRRFSRISLDPPEIVSGSVVVATFHTHPMDPFTGASDTDRQVSSQQGVPGIVLGRNGQVDIVGPNIRAGDWSASPLFPGFPP